MKRTPILPLQTNGRDEPSCSPQGRHIGLPLLDGFARLWRARNNGGIMLLFLLFFSTSCATQNLKQDLTTQTLSNNSLQFYTALAQNFFTVLEGSTNCAGIEAALQSLAGTENCTNGGTLETTLTHFSCEESPELQANAEIEQNFVACQEPGENLQGVIDTSLSWNGAQLESTLSSTAFFYNGLPQSFNPLHIDIEEGEAQCSGVLITQGQVCNVTPNCQFCPL